MGISQIIGKIFATGAERSGAAASRVAASEAPAVGRPASRVATGFVPGTGHVQQVDLAKYVHDLRSEAGSLRGKGYSPRLAEIEHTLSAIAEHQRRPIPSMPAYHSAPQPLVPREPSIDPNPTGIFKIPEQFVQPAAQPIAATPARRFTAPSHRDYPTVDYKLRR